MWEALGGLVVAVCVAVVLFMAFGEHKDPCNVPENNLTKDYLVCKARQEQDDADVALLSTTIMLAGATSQ